MLKNELIDTIQFDDNLFKEYILKYFKISNYHIVFKEFSGIYLNGEDYASNNLKKIFENEIIYKKFDLYYQNIIKDSDNHFIFEINQNKYKIQKRYSRFRIYLIDTNIKQVIKDFNIDVSNINFSTLIEYDSLSIEKYIDTIKDIKKDLNLLFL